MSIRCFPLIIALFALLFPCLSFSQALATLVPPPGLQLVNGVTTLPVSVTPAANSPFIRQGHVFANATLNLGSRTITVPVAMRIAANASVFAATRLNPYVAAASFAVGAFGLLHSWFAADPEAPPLGLTPDGKIVSPFSSPDVLAPLVRMPDTGYLYYDDVSRSYRNASELGGMCISPDAWDANLLIFHTFPAFRSFIYAENGGGGPCNLTNGSVGVRLVSGCTSGPGTVPRSNYMLPSGGMVVHFCSVSALRNVTSSTAPPAISRLASPGLAPIPPSLIPFISPDTPIDPNPVINPIIPPPGFAVNPSAEPRIGPNANPYPVINPSTMRVPNGQSVPVPNTSPQRYDTPWLDITPTPSPADPWRVTVTQVIIRNTTNHSDLPVAAPPPVAPPPVVMPSNCVLFPNSLGCIPLVSPVSDILPVSTVPIALQIGPSFSGGSCPADTVVSLSSFQFPLFHSATACAWVTSARYVIILLASLSAMTIVRPGGNKIRVESSAD